MKIQNQISKKLINLVLCGGSGTRLWPLSRTNLPKQFLKIFNGQSTFQKTLLGNHSISSKHLIVGNINLQNLIIEQSSNLNLSAISYVWETASRNTAPALTLACLHLLPDDIVLVTPADHLIDYCDAYFEAINMAHEQAFNGHIVTFGITPKYAHTGYGYIEFQDTWVTRFHEKPTIKVAEGYLSNGNFLWNSGMYCFKVDTFLKEMQNHAPEVYISVSNAFNKGQMTLGKIAPTELAQQAPNISVDYALMEKLHDLKVIHSHFNWDDIGSFESLSEVLTNFDISNSNIIQHECKNSLILSNNRAIAAIGLENLIVVDTPDALLLAKQGSSHLIKELLPQIDTQLTNDHSYEERPWGSFSVLDKDITFKVKKITVKPGKRLSLQRHLYRSEHWIVVSGIATVINGNDTFELFPNQSIYIPLGQQHRLENSGENDLVLIEVQHGSYTGEDDIIRLDDDYERHMTEQVLQKD